MNIIEKLNWRYATKKFDDTKIIPQHQVDLLKEAFNLTATSYGLQPIKLLVIKDKELQAKLVEHSWNQKQVAQASHVLVFCIHTNLDTQYIKDHFKRVKNVRNTPDEILKPFEDYLVEDFSKKSQDYVENWSAKQAYLAMGNLLTVCAIEGIDACPMEGFIPEAYDKLLNLEERNLKSVLVMPIGYRAEDDFQSGLKKVRKGVAESTYEL